MARTFTEKILFDSFSHLSDDDFLKVCSLVDELSLAPAPLYNPIIGKQYLQNLRSSLSVVSTQDRELSIKYMNEFFKSTRSKRYHPIKQQSEIIEL